MEDVVETLFFFVKNPIIYPVEIYECNIELEGIVFSSKAIIVLVFHSSTFELYIYYFVCSLVTMIFLTSGNA